MKLIFLAGIVPFVEDVIPAVDVDVGDVVVLPDANDPVLVNRVRLGQGGLIFTVTSDSSDSPEEDRPVKLTAEVRLRRRGRDMAPRRWSGACAGERDAGPYAEYHGSAHWHTLVRATSPDSQSSLAMWSTAARTAIASSEYPIRPIADQGDCQGMSPVRRARLAGDREEVPRVIGNPHEVIAHPRRPQRDGDRDTAVRSA